MPAVRSASRLRHAALAAAVSGCIAPVHVAAADAPPIGSPPSSAPQEVAPGASARLAFDRHSPLASGGEILRRTSTPIAVNRALAYLKEHAQRLPEDPVDLSNEHFHVYVPTGDPPAGGYGVFVFIPPWDDGSVPPEWRRVFDRHGMIYVAADLSGNDASMLERRFPLALDAYENVAARYHVDPARVVVSGFSGGSRTAFRMALTYPDVFRGAVLNSGSDPFGVPGIAVPPAELFALFRERSRLVVVSGTDDLPIVARDAAMADAADRLCMPHVDQQPMRNTSHALMRAAMLDHALESIEAPDAIAERHADALARCRARVDAEVAKDLQEVRDLLASGKRGEAARTLSKIDERYGGLAAPASLELARQLLAK